MNSNYKAGVALAILATVAAPSVQAADTYKIVGAKSRVTIFSKTTSPVAGLISRLAHTREMRTSSVSGSVVMDGPCKPKSVDVSVSASSLSVVKKDDLNDDNLVTVDKVTRDKILEAGTYPKITFKSSGMNLKFTGSNFKGSVKGSFTLHGVTKKVSVPMSGSVAGNTIKAKGSLSIDQTTYGITLLSFMGGMVSVTDPVTINLDITASK